jgi:glycosyltransferase involved in cell wall biosynthesis
VREIGIDWPVSSYTGWGVFGLHLSLEMVRSRRARPILFHPPDVDLTPAQARLLAEAEIRAAPANRRVDFPVLHALGNGLCDLGVVRGDGDSGLVFFEDTNLDCGSRGRGGALKTIIAGSVWNGRLLEQAGLANVQVAQQGVDETVFYPGPKPGRFKGRFTVFSGGKLEYRKAQDLVLSAFRLFLKRHPEALLAAAWHNYSADAARTFDPPPALDGAGRPDVTGWAERNGVPRENFLDLGFVPNRALGDVLRDCDAALFPNRCEGGTNLPAMECLASGLPVILSANTGHLDLTQSVPCHALLRQGPVDAAQAGMGTVGWGESDLGECQAKLEEIYQDPARARALGLAAAKAMFAWSWPVRAAAVLDALAL